MYLDGFITMPTFRPDGRLDALNKGADESVQVLMSAAQEAEERKRMQKRGSRPAGSGLPQSFLKRSAPRPTTSISTPEATVGNNVGAKRKSLLGAATS
jgi:hypothetical protein